VTEEMVLFTTDFFHKLGKQVYPAIMQKTWCVLEDQAFSCQDVLCKNKGDPFKPAVSAVVESSSTEWSNTVFCEFVP
jgi:hypothetical protein